MRPPRPCCPSCSTEAFAVPLVLARVLNRPESAGGLPLACPACGEGFNGTPDEIATVEAAEAADVAAARRRERLWRLERDPRAAAVRPLLERGLAAEIGDLDDLLFEVLCAVEEADQRLPRLAAAVQAAKEDLRAERAQRVAAEAQVERLRSEVERLNPPPLQLGLFDEQRGGATGGGRS